jgi:hypothetical protein
MWERGQRRSLRALVAVSLLAAGAVFGIDARAADQAGELEKGRQFFLDGRADLAEKFLGDALDGPAPSIIDKALRARGRMILGAADYQLGKPAQASQQWEKILRDDVDFTPDPLLFSKSVIEAFEAERQKIVRENAVKSGISKALDDERAARMRLQSRYDALKSFASTETVVTRHSRWVAAIPFGVGQFQNGDPTLGYTFASLEGALAITSIASFVRWSTIPAITANIGPERDARLVNEISFAALCVAAISGILQAELAFVPETSATRPRTLPPAYAWRWSPVFAPSRDGATLGVFVAF